MPRFELVGNEGNNEDGVTTMNRTLDICFYEAFEEEADSLRRQIKARGLKIRATYTSKTIQEAGDIAPTGRVVSIRTQSTIPDVWMTKIEGVLSRTTGYDHIAAFLNRTKTKLPCGYLPVYCARAVAEQAALLWMALLRKLPQQIRQFSTFNRDGLTGHECEGKKILCIGVGNIGYQVLKIARGLGMQTRGVDIVKRHDDVTYVAPLNGLAWADVIVCAMNLTPQNIGYFDYQTLKRAKRGVLFVNIARGELSPPAPLLRLIDEGHLGGVALDVYDRESEIAVALRTGKKVSSESLRATIELSRRANVIFTPHNAFNTEEAVERKSAQSIEQLAHFLKHGQFIWTVPHPSGV